MSSENEALVASLKSHYGAAARKAGGGRPVVEDCGCSTTTECCGSPVTTSRERG
jgi:hypothetical protein